MDVLSVPIAFVPKAKPSHTVFLKKYAPKEVSSLKPVERTLQLLNVPPYCSGTCLQENFSRQGDGADVQFFDDSLSKQQFSYDELERHEGFKSGCLVFKKKIFLERSLKNTKVCTLKEEDVKRSNGISKWCEDYTRVFKPEDIQADIDAFMAKYDETKAVEKATQKQESANEDGWTVVTHKRRFPTQLKKDSEIPPEKRAKNSQCHFYPFQFRLKRLNEIDQLREKYARDKQRIEEMKKSRRFRPFGNTV